MSQVELIERAVGGDRPVLRRTHRDFSGDERDLIFSRHRLGSENAGRYDLKFAWKSDIGSVSQRTEALLQLLSDFVTQSLTRLESRYAPSVETEVTKRGAQAEESQVATAIAHAKS
jgi:hypothetical protein